MMGEIGTGIALGHPSGLDFTATFPHSQGQVLPLGCNELCRDSATPTAAVSGAFSPCECRGIPAGLPPVLENGINQKQE